MKKTILVTGGCGFLGQNLLRNLAAGGDYNLICLDRYEAPFLAECGVRFLAGDINEEQKLETAMAGVDTVIHLACAILPQTSNLEPDYDLNTNVGGSLKLLKAAVHHQVRKFIFLSSGGTVYGVPQQLPIPETHPTNPTCSYGICKLTVEKYLRLIGREHGLQTCSLRLANPYGPHQRVNSAQGAVSVFCYKALTGQQIEVWGDGSVQRDFLYVDDAVAAMRRTLETAELPPEMNIGSGTATSISGLLEQIAAVTGRKLFVNFLPGRRFDVPVNKLDITLARKVLGWEPQTGLTEGLGKTIDFIRQNCRI